MSRIKQTAGRDSLGEFAPEFARLNDDVLFGEVWSREEQLSLKLRSIATVTALVSKGMVDSSFKYHAQTAKQNGVTAVEMAELLTHIAFYAGWPNAWAAFRIVKEVYEDQSSEGEHGGMFGIGVIIGIFTMRQRAEDRSLYAWRERAGIRNTARSRRA